MIPRIDKFTIVERPMMMAYNSEKTKRMLEILEALKHLDNSKSIQITQKEVGYGSKAALQNALRKAAKVNKLLDVSPCVVEKDKLWYVFNR